MVRSISPNYYAANSQAPDYELSGLNFGLIPNDAVGVISSDNENPLTNIDTTFSALLYTISEKDDGRMLLVHQIQETLGADSYLGAIVSEDRQTIYWVNETKPLP